jgi:hypothetical protein
MYKIFFFISLLAGGQGLGKTIPRNIINVWHTCPSCSNELPRKFKLWQQSCKELYPDYTFHLLSSENSRQFIEKHYPQYLAMYDSYEIFDGMTVNIERIDAIRYFYLHYFGGIYMDIDIMCLRRFPKWQKPTFGYLYKDYDGHKSAIANGFMATPANHSLFLKIIEQLPIAAVAHENVMDTTGPAFLTRLIQQFGLSKVNVLEMPKIFPFQWNLKKKETKCSTVHECRNEFPLSYTMDNYLQSWIPNWRLNFPLNSMGGQFECVGGSLLQITWMLDKQSFATFNIEEDNYVNFVESFKENVARESIRLSSAECITLSIRESYWREGILALCNFAERILHIKQQRIWSVDALLKIIGALIEEENEIFIDSPINRKIKQLIHGVHEHVVEFKSGRRDLALAGLKTVRKKFLGLDISKGDSFDL